MSAEELILEYSLLMYFGILPSEVKEEGDG
jgi:hypothetical protein